MNSLLEQFNQLEPIIVYAQNQYLISKGLYCQLPRPNSIPSFGNYTICNWKLKNNDVGLSWTDSYIANYLPQSLPFSPKCDVYTDENGVNWFSVLIDILQDNKNYQYKKSYSSDGRILEQDWMRVFYD